jgi:hypothetical protein
MTAGKLVKPKTAQDWLLEENQPSIRYLALTKLLGKPKNDAEVESAKQMITKQGWAADILSKQTLGGWWTEEESFYRPKYISTNWMLLILSDLGLSRADSRIARACQLWIERFAKKDGGFGADGWSKSHLCIVGNTARALVKFGYVDHPKVRSAFEWLVRNQAKKGGWSCFGSGRNLDSWEAMSAFAAYPTQKWTKSMKRSVDLGAEFYLERELHKQGTRYRPWYRFHYPIHYYYDLLVGLDFITALGYGDDRRLRHALTVLRKKRRRDGRWNLDAVHPDLEGSMALWYSKDPKRKPIPFALETPGQPSKMVTLTAMQVMNRLNIAT